MKRVSWSAGWGGFYLIGGHGAKCRPALFTSPRLRGEVDLERSSKSGEGVQSFQLKEPLTRSPDGSRPLPVRTGRGEELSPPPRPSRRHREREPAHDQERAAG